MEFKCLFAPKTGWQSYSAVPLPWGACRPLPPLLRRVPCLAANKSRPRYSLPIIRPVRQENVNRASWGFKDTVDGAFDLLFSVPPVIFLDTFSSCGYTIKHGKTG